MKKLRVLMPTSPSTSPSLRRLLAGVLAQAEAFPGQKATVRLTTNLKVDVTLQGGEGGCAALVCLEISRSTRWPAESEWRTILHHWPYPVEAAPQRVLQLGRHYLTASWSGLPRRVTAG